MTGDLISKDLSEDPIKIPGNPFWSVFKRFGLDELISMIINVIGTFIVSIFVGVPIILSLAGPIIEKIGFFPMHIREAIKIHKTTPKDQRKSFSHYFSREMKKGVTSLTEDILVHDPIYIILMLVGLYIYPGSPVWMLSAMSFIIAVFAVSGIEVGVKEAQYIKFKKKLKKVGFDSEVYYESRFFISSNEDQDKVLKKIAKKFNLKTMKRLNYKDKYFENNFSEFSGRLPNLRLRKRTNEKKKGFIQTLQIIYTRAIETSKNNYEQYRYFPIKKEKFYYMLNKKMPESIDEIQNEKIKKVIKNSKKKELIKRVEFSRKASRSEDLLVSVDSLQGKRDFYVLEVKTHKNIKLLIEAMRFIMREFPVVQTTKSKKDFSL